jgi:hypothetical protein
MSAPSEQHETIADMMRSYAEQAVKLAPKLGARLDYSEASLEVLEKIVAELASERPMPSGPHGAKDDPAQPQLDAMARVWGAYFGEVLCRVWHGEWGVETYPGTVAPVVSVDVGGRKVFPVMKVYRRLSGGADESIWSFYQMVRSKLQPARVQ